MNYRTDRHNEPLSILGYGCMRFTRKGSGIDIEKAEKEVMYAIRNGVNYLDTAYVYPGSEEAVGIILEKNSCRDQVKLATKLPHYLIKSRNGAEKKFQEELTRLRTDHVDYYLMHMLNDVKTWEKLLELGIGDWIRQKKESGQIRNIGFSFHGNSGNFIELLDAWDWDFCQIQYNYLDENSQAGRRGLEYAGKKGIPVIIMEPLRGGKLVNDLSEETRQLIRQDPKKRTAAELALRWLWDQPQVTVVLSGMNSMEMVKENIRLAGDAQAGDFSQEDHDMIRKIRDSINRNMKVGCTGCGYCMPCPKGVDIPMAFHCYNLRYTEGKKSGNWEYLQATAMRRVTTSASQCVGCGRCEKHCPQHLPIREKLKEASRELETPVYKGMKWAVHAFRIYG